MDKQIKLKINILNNLSYTTFNFTNKMLIRIMLRWFQL